MRLMLRIFVATTLAIWACAESHATLVKWTLNNVTFTDGGTASGFFIVDTSTGQLAVTPPPEGSLEYGGFDIKTTSGSVLTAIQYVPFVSAGGQQIYEVESHRVHASFSMASFGSNLLLNTDADLQHTTRGTFNVLADPAIDCGTSDDRCSGEGRFGGDLECCGCCPPSAFRPVAGGTVTATVVPEPSSLAFLGLAGGLLVMMRRRPWF